MNDCSFPWGSPNLVILSLKSGSLIEMAVHQGTFPSEKCAYQIGLYKQLQTPWLHQFQERDLISAIIHSLQGLHVYNTKLDSTVSMALQGPEPCTFISIHKHFNHKLSFICFGRKVVLTSFPWAVFLAFWCDMSNFVIVCLIHPSCVPLHAVLDHVVVTGALETNRVTLAHISRKFLSVCKCLLNRCSDWLSRFLVISHNGSSPDY